MSSRIKKYIANIFGSIIDAGIDIVARGTKDFFFIQIGACDGLFCDPIRKYILKYRWNGILIEPVRYLFERLVNNYRGIDGLVFENVAIAETDGIRDIYRYRENQADLPAWAEGTASLLMNFTSRHQGKISNIEGRLISEKVETLTLSTLLKKHGVKKIDLLLIDTEGYDYRIIETIDFVNIKPRMIYFEKICLTDCEYRECIKLLEGNGYCLISVSENTFAFLKNLRLKMYSGLLSTCIKHLPYKIFRHLMYPKRGVKKV